MVVKAHEIIKTIKPKVWFMENPRAMLRVMDCMKDLPRHTISYCAYGERRQKPTDIWTNSTLWKPRPMCKKGMPCHDAAPRGSKTGTQGIKGAFLRGKLPDELCKEIILTCEMELKA